ncbi:MAG: hypothetical protein KAH31_11450, partial [Candidatus Sabulitectum sp.]|nr:hypothetical protein [Candidatus Sabulitectum sp.]
LPVSDVGCSSIPVSWSKSIFLHSFRWKNTYNVQCPPPKWRAMIRKEGVKEFVFSPHAINESL